MNVNIVSPWSIQHDHILRRMTDRLPWPVTERPKPGALNYFFPYQSYRAGAGYNVALFSHDMGHPKWEIAASETDMRLAWTDIYTRPLSEHGLTRRVIPGIDHDLFTPGDEVTAPVVGVVGLVYGDGRKGEDLWARLVKDKGQEWQLRAAGAGWAGNCRHVPYADMPGFMRGLNVLLCCSRVEGVPYPPLEALACGVKVVIPRGVGLLDELPDTPGIVRFGAGNYDDMVTAVKAALNTKADRYELRYGVDGYTWDEWTAGHVRAFEELMA